MRLLLGLPSSTGLRADCQDGAALVVASAKGHAHLVTMLLEWPVDAPKANCWSSQVRQAAGGIGVTRSDQRSVSGACLSLFC